MQTKKLITNLLIGVLTVTVIACSGESSSVATPKIYMAFTVQDLTNPVWGATAENLKLICASNNIDLTVVDCAGNSANQITQMENFIQKGLDVIAIHPAEINALQPIMQKARDAGIKVFCWDEDTDNADVSWLVDNFEFGKSIGMEAGKWINEKLNGSTDVAIVEYSVYPNLIKRADGIVAGIKQISPNARIVVRDSAINAAEGMPMAESFLQSNPNIKVVACIGDGSAIGVNEAVKASGKATSDFGIFAADATDEACDKISKQNEPFRASVSLGTPKQLAEQVFDICMKLVNNEDIDSKIYRQFKVVNENNVQDYMAGKI